MNNDCQSLRAPDVQDDLPVLPRIGEQLKRVIGATGVQVRLESHPGCPDLVRIETEEAEWRMFPTDFLHLLDELPDRAGILALRVAADRHPRKIPAE